MTTYDVLIVGGGAAGLSAGLVLARARRSVLIADAGRPRNAPAAHMHGFLGSEGLPPSELLAAGRREVLGYGAELRSGTVSGISLLGDPDRPAGFEAVLDHGEPVRARRVLVTTGLSDELPEVPGLAERWGRDVLHCPYCHGYEVRDQPVGVVGGTDEAVAHAQLVRQWTAAVTYFTHGSAPTAEQRERLEARGIRVVDGTVAGLVIEDDLLRGVRLEAGEIIPVSAVFVRPRFVPHSVLLTQLGCAADAAGWPVVDATGRTSQPGVWAAGNAANPRAQVITAAGEGSAAAIAINNHLVEEEVATAVQRR